MGWDDGVPTIFPPNPSYKRLWDSTIKGLFLEADSDVHANGVSNNTSATDRSVTNMQECSQASK
ncbi:hypothetical protein AMTR_s00028p00095290 [Amborella trichopoda]|uniref:Uncharacterized protein n=1 Tax=Amborella trichopoda TaxID=13333 RepID=W1PRW0_AMBTC|nr:hypothetical protein AMTR_s00028p00095290 [Amborella trichopoda]